MLEQQQAVMLEVLRNARGAPLSYTQLHDAGIEYPASVVSELELAGVPIERCFLDAQAARGAGVRLDPTRDIASTDASAGAECLFGPRPTVEPQRRDTPAGLRSLTERLARSGVAALEFASVMLGLCLSAVRRWMVWLSHALRSISEWARRYLSAIRAEGQLARERRALRRIDIGDSLKPPSAGLMSARWLAVGALVATFGVVIALVLVELTAGGNGRAPRAIAHHPARSIELPAASHLSAPAPTVRAARVQPRAPVSVQQRTPVSAGLAVKLEARGHELLETGQYRTAARILPRAVAATGERLKRCVEPVSESCLTYAYALYDLGRALQLSGHPAAAVPVLENRLRIDNQRATVLAELELARAHTR